MELLKQLQEMGFPPWFVISTGVIVVLAMFGLVNPIGYGISKFSAYIAKRVETIQKSRYQIELTEVQTKKLSTLRDDYSQNYLMEQVTINHAEAQVQLGESNNFIREAYKRLEDNIEKGVTQNTLDIQSIKTELENMNEKINQFFTELDIANRHYEELKELLRNGR